MITTTNLTKSYGDLKVLKGVSLNLKEAEVVSIVGASGAGKSTLLHILGTLDVADEGELTIHGKEINTMGKNELAKFRNENLGFIFQFHHLLPEFTALENVCIPAFIAGSKKSVAEKRAKELLTFLGLDQRLEHKPATMSGGEQQRVAVARALMNKPLVVFADEPSGNLDSQNAKELHQLFFDLRDKFGQTFVIITHNEDLANMADRKLSMQDGNIIDS